MDLRNKITLMALSDITPYENNPRNNEEAVEKVANSIKEFGFNQPMSLFLKLRKHIDLTIRTHFSIHMT